MRFSSLMSLGMVAAVKAATFSQEVDEGIPDTGLDISGWTAGQLPPLTDMMCVNDFQMAAKNVLAPADYAYYRTASADETTYINNMEIWKKVRMNRYSFADNSDVNLDTSILGYDFSLPYFITAAAAAGKGNANAELNFVNAAANANMLYIASISATKSIEEIGGAAHDGQTMFHQEYIWADEDRIQDELNRMEEQGFKAVFITVDNFSVNGMRTRSQRFSGPGGYNSNHDQVFSPAKFNRIQSMTSLPLIPKGVASAAEVKMFADMGVPAVYISNHGGRQIDGSPTTLEILLDLHANYPEVFNQIEIYADGGVRRPQHILTLLALGVRAVGLGRPPMFANVFGQAGVARMFANLRLEMVTTMKNLGSSDINTFRGNTTFINTREIELNYFGAPLSSGTNSNPHVISTPPTNNKKRGGEFLGMDESVF